MISVSITEKRFEKRTILQHVSFDISEGETVAITGPSGIGKSTLLRIIAGLDTDFTGTVEKPDAVGLVFQEPTLLPWRSVFENLTLMHPTVSRSEIDTMLVKVGLSGRQTDWPHQLSLGQQRRLSLARACLGDPKLLVLDEPFVSLDRATSADMISLTQTLIEDKRPATVLVTHDRSEADALADRIYELSGEPASLRAIK